MTPPQRQLFGFNPMLGWQVAGRHINVAFTCLKRNAFQIGRLCVVGWILRYWATEFAFLLVFSFVGLLVIQQTVLRLSKPILTDRVLVLDHLSPIPQEEKNVYADDLRTTNDGHIQLLWNRSASKGPIKILLTGVTGYVGKATLYEILSLIAKSPSENNFSSKVYVTVRPKLDRKSGYCIAASDRVKAIRDDTIFSHLKAVWDDTVEVIETGDLARPSCGLPPATLSRLRSENITHVVHCAADVKFVSPLEEIAAANITASLQMQSFAREWRCERFVYVSTAFVNPQSGTPDEPIAEKLSPLAKYNPLELYQSMLGDQWMARKAIKELGFQNNYVFSKCVCEHLLSRDTATATRIIRPSIVGPAWVAPYAGWNGDQPSTVTKILIMYRTGVASAFCYADCQRPVVPVDYVAVAIVHATMSELDVSNTQNMRKQEMQCWIRNIVWEANCEEHLLKFWALSGRMAPTSAALVLLLSRFLNNYPHCFSRLHTFLNIWPLKVLDKFEMLQRWLLLQKTTRQKISAKSLLGLVAMLPVSEPFMVRKFYFQRSSRIPEHLTPELYLLCLLRAVENFVPPKLRPVSPRLESTPMALGVTYVNLIPKNRSDLWWAMTMPQGNMTIRIAAIIVAKVLRRVCRDVHVDLQTISSLAKALKNDRDCPVCLVPTHRSFLDFILVSYICFSMPGLGIKVPHIAAAIEFKDLSFSWLLESAQAFWVVRDSQDKDLTVQIQRLIANGKHLMVFLEGSRSRDRRFLRPRTGFLRALQAACKRSGRGAPLMVPICLDYERVPEHQNMCNDIASGFKMTSLSSKGLLGWVSAVMRDDVRLGDVRISFGNPSRLGINDDIQATASKLQQQHLHLSAITGTHLLAAELHLSIPKDTLRKALAEIGGKYNGESSLVDLIPELTSVECWSFHIQWMYRFAPYLKESHPLWAEWFLNERHLEKEGLQSWSYHKGTSSGFLRTLSQVRGMLNTLDALAKSSDANLTRKGINAATAEHIAREMERIGYMEGHGYISNPIATAAAEFVVRKKPLPSDAISSDEMEGAVEPIFNSLACNSNNGDVVGRWGYADSGFALIPSSRRGEQPTVYFKGSRYSISGKHFPTLLTMFGEQLGVRLNYAGKPMLPSHCLIPAIDDENSNNVSTGIQLLLLEQGFSEDQISLDVRERYRHGTGHSQADMFHLRSGQVHRFPDAIVWPQSEAECVRLVEVAEKNGICLIPFGGGTNVTHATWCPPKEVDSRPVISVDMKQMNRVLWVHKRDRTAHVQAGIVGKDLVQELEKHGLTMGHEPDSIEFSTLGGWVATRASGMKRSRYGNIEDIIREVRIVTPQGVLSQHHHLDNPDNNEQARCSAFGRSSIGTELKDLVLGSEGNLGLITSCVIRVHPLPDVKQYGSIVFPTFKAGLAFMEGLSGFVGALRPASVRLVDNIQVQMGSQFSTTNGHLSKLISKAYIVGLGWNPKEISACTIAYEGRAEEVSIQKKVVGQLARKHGGIQSGSSNGSAGYSMTFAIAYIRDFALDHSIVAESFETFAPWSRCAEVCAGVKKDIERIHHRRSLPGKPVLSSRVTQIYDEGACIYFYLSIYVEGISKPSEVFASLEEAARKSCLRHGGSLSHHHGIGKLRSNFLLSEVNNKPLNEWLSSIKAGVDASNVFGVRNGVCSVRCPQKACDDDDDDDDDDDGGGDDCCIDTITRQRLYAQKQNSNFSNITGCTASSSASESGAPPLSSAKAGSIDDPIFVDASSSFEEHVNATKTSTTGSIDVRFVQASNDVRQHLSSDISNDHKSQLYSLYKQATEGPCTLAPPNGFFQPVARAKHDAWSRLGDMSSSQAKEEYVRLARELLEISK